MQSWFSHSWPGGHANYHKHSQQEPCYCACHGQATTHIGILRQADMTVTLLQPSLLVNLFGVIICVRAMRK